MSQESIATPSTETSPLFPLVLGRTDSEQERVAARVGLEWDDSCPDPRDASLSPTHLDQLGEDGDDIEQRRLSSRKVIGGDVKFHSNGDALRYLEEDDDVDASRHTRSRSQRSVPRVAFDVAATCLGIGPLIIPHAMQLTGLAIGLPMLFITAALSWFSHTSLAVEARYVGGTSLQNLSSSVFPTRFGGQIASEILVDLFVLFVAMARTISILYCSSSLVSRSNIIFVLEVAEIIGHGIQLAAFAADAINRFNLLQNTTWLTIIIVILYLIPTLITPGKNRFLTHPQWSLIHSAAPVLYMFALIVIGIRVHKLKVYSANALQRRRFSWNFYASLREEAMGYSIWGGIAIILFTLVSHHSSFEHQRSLRQTSRTSVKRNSIAPLPTLKAVKQHGWETASFCGLLGASLVLLAWALVGYLAVPLPEGYGQPGNILSALPVNDGWLSFARLILVIALLSGLPSSIRPARKTVKRLLMLPTRFSKPALGSDASSKHKQYRGRTHSRASELEMDASSSDDTEVDNGANVSPLHKLWLNRLASVMVYTTALVVTLATVRNDQDLSSLVEITGCLGSTFIGLIIPATFFVVLFHIRKARNIFVTDLSNPIMAQDDLLIKKEAQLQRRLSGRRLHQDFITFAGLLPMGIVIFIRGCIALASVSTVT